ncbi:MAG: hypothetical protein J0I06_10375, partial [Planctomycetes bacterium]|nr:hypothetical protein [Planctomycetota bacterium]
MRPIVAAVVLLGFTAPATAAERPLVEKYLHAGELARGEQALTLALDKDPRDDRTRFALGMLQFVRAVERLGQALHQYGAQSENAWAPFLRIPVPHNDKPHAISYEALGRVFDVFLADLDRAERTLAGVTDDRVKLPLRLAGVRLDLTGAGKPTDKFIDVLVKLNRGRFEFQKDNPEFLVCFDRGDVAWLRAYCHLLSAMVEAYRALDLEAFFDERVKNVFPKVEPSKRKPEAGAETALVIADGVRFGRFRKHMLAVCELNRETWRFIRAETDDDHEWLPNAKQAGVLGLPVSDQRINGWLDMIDRLEELFKGERLISADLLTMIGLNTDGKGLNVRTLLDDPPASVSEK